MTNKATILKTILLLCALVAGTEHMGGGNTYVKVTQGSDLVAGDVYIIATNTVIATNFDSSTGCLATTNTGFTCTTSGTITTTTAVPMEFTLGVTNGNFTLKNGNYYLGYANSSNVQYLRFSQTNSSDTKEQWKIYSNTTYGLYLVSVPTITEDSKRYICVIDDSQVFRAYLTGYMSSFPPANLYKKVASADISDAGWRTYAPAYAVRFREGTNAYVVSGANSTTATLQKVTSVPAGTPVLLEGASGTHTMDVVSTATSVSDNCLHVSNGTNPEGDMYVLSKVDDAVGFYLWDKTFTLPEGKIYLQLNTTGGARPFIALPGEETGIGAALMNDGQSTMNNDVCDLQGRRVLSPHTSHLTPLKKGLYIVNGKKVVVK